MQRHIIVYTKCVALGALIFIAVVMAYVAIWNLIVTYAVIPAPAPASGMVTATVTSLTTSVYNITDSATTQQTSTVYNETYTATRCISNATSCTGMGERVDVVVNHPIIPYTSWPTIPTFDTAYSGTWVGADFGFYHAVYFTSATVIIASWTALRLVDVHLKLARRFVK